MRIRTLAQELLDNELFHSILDEMKKSYYDDWQSAGTIEDREALHSKLRVCEDVVSVLQAKALETSK